MCRRFKSDENGCGTMNAHCLESLAASPARALSTAAGGIVDFSRHEKLQSGRNTDHQANMDVWKSMLPKFPLHTCVSMAGASLTAVVESQLWCSDRILSVNPDTKAASVNSF